MVESIVEGGEKRQVRVKITVVYSDVYASSRYMDLGMPLIGAVALAIIPPGGSVRIYAV